MMSNILWNSFPQHVIENGKYTIVGYSRAANNTGFYIKELELLLDAGIETTGKLKLILITHGHLDHSYMITKCISCNKIKPNVICPINIIEYLQNFIVSAENMNDLDKSYAINKIQIYGLESNNMFQYNLKRGIYYIETFKCYHSVPTLGYGIYKYSRKLKSIYYPCKGRCSENCNCNKMKMIEDSRNGHEIYDYIVNKFLCYLCDTTIDVFNDERIFEYSTIMIECTFLYQEDKDNAIKTNHVHWDDLEPYIELYPNCYFILFHFSLRYDDDAIHEFFTPYLEKYNNFKIWI